MNEKQKVKLLKEKISEKAHNPWSINLYTLHKIIDEVFNGNGKEN